MAIISLRTAALIAFLSSALYQTILRDILTKLGVSRTVQPITDFSSTYTCRRVSTPGLEACEDMWLDEVNRQMYLMCSSVGSRREWLPNMGLLDERAVALDAGGAVYVMDIDRPGVDGGYVVRKLRVEGFHGTRGEGALLGLSVSGRLRPGSPKGKGTVELFIVNNKPSLRPGSGGNVLADNVETGANSTVELFETDPGSSTMRYVRTFAHPDIATPNNVALIPDGSGFYITNDHGVHKTGIKHTLSPYLFTGNVVYCTAQPSSSSSPSACKVVATGLSFPNGLTIHPQDPRTLYVPSAGIGKGVAIFKIDPRTGGLTKITDLAVPYPLDNLTPGSDGAIYAAAFPKAPETIKTFTDPVTFDDNIAVTRRVSPPAAALKINKLHNLVNDGHEVTWSWEKVIEDARGQHLPGTTTVVKDAKTERLFMSGVLSYFITVCEPR